MRASISRAKLSNSRRCISLQWYSFNPRFSRASWVGQEGTVRTTSSSLLLDPVAHQKMPGPVAQGLDKALEPPLLNMEAFPEVPGGHRRDFAPDFFVDAVRACLVKEFGEIDVPERVHHPVMPEQKLDIFPGGRGFHLFQSRQIHVPSFPTSAADGLPNPRGMARPAYYTAPKRGERARKIKPLEILENLAGGGGDSRSFPDDTGHFSEVALFFQADAVSLRPDLLQALGL